MPVDTKTVGRCGTRLLHNLRALRERAPHLVDEDHGSGAGVLSSEQLRVADDPVLLAAAGASPAQLDAVASAHLEQRSLKQVGGMFHGTIHVVDMAFRVTGMNNTIFRFARADIQMVIQYLTAACPTISRYATQYGPNSVAVSPVALVAQVDLPTTKYNNGWVTNWVNTIAKDSAIPATDCIVLLNHPQVTNTDAVKQGFDGFHDSAKCLYTFSLVGGTGLTLKDDAFLYAVPLSHEIAEMVVDPHPNANPEVCDDCANNCGHLTLNCFKLPASFVGTVTDAALNFAYDYYISGIAQPDFIGACPAPPPACGYWPEVWSPLGGNQLTGLGAAPDRNGNLELFALGDGGAIFHLIQNAGGWGGWTSLLGHQLREFAVANNDDGRIELLAVGGDGAIYHIWQTRPNNDWGQWASLGGTKLQHVTAVIDPSRALVAFALDSAGAVWTNAQTGPNANWGAWQSLQGNNLKQVAASVNGNQLVLCALGGDGTVYFRVRSANGAWSAWSSVPGVTMSQIALAANPGAGLLLFGVSKAHTIAVANQPAGSANWGGWTDLGGLGLKGVAAAANANGLLEVITIGGNNRAYHLRQQGMPGPWGAWSGLAATTKLEFDQLLPILKPNGELELFGLTSGTVFHISQTAPNGAWS